MTAKVAEFIDSEFQVYFNEEEGCEAVSSTRILDQPGRWQMCEQTAYYGGCREVVEDPPCQTENSYEKITRSTWPKSTVKRLMKLGLKPLVAKYSLSLPRLSRETPARPEKRKFPQEAPEVSSSSDMSSKKKVRSHTTYREVGQEVQQISLPLSDLAKANQTSTHQSPDTSAKSSSETLQANPSEASLGQGLWEDFVLQSSEASPKKSTSAESSPRVLDMSRLEPRSSNIVDSSSGHHPLRSLDSLEDFLGDEFPESCLDSSIR